MSWVLITEPPPAENDDLLFCLRSIPVLGLFADDRMSMVRYYFDPEEGTSRWRTEDSEEWDVTGKLTHWTYPPSLPIRGK